MFVRIFALFALAFALSGTQCWAVSSPNCTPGDGFIACQFSPTVTSATFDFGTDGVLAFQFDTVLTSFEVDVAAVENAPFSFTGSDFPTGTECIPYTGPGGNGGSCVRYNVTGALGGPVPVKDVNFKGLITVTLNYNSEILVQIPAFGHAPGDSTTAPFSENILTLYVDPAAPPTVCPSCTEPAMGGKIPGMSSFEAFTIPFAPSIQPGDTVCSLTEVPQNSTSGNNPLIEVSFSLVAAGGDCTKGPFLRDKTATLSVGTLVKGNVAFTTLVNGGDSNKFHFDNTDGLNVQDINTNGLVPGTTYYVTVISEVFPPVTITFVK